MSAVLAKLSVLLFSVALAQGVYTVTPVTSPILAPTSPVAAFLPQDWVSSESIKFGVNPALSACIIRHESNWDDKRVGDIGNPRGESFGLWQIELKQHADISYTEAMNFESSTDWALKKIKEGHIGWWSTFSQPPYWCGNISLWTN